MDLDCTKEIRLENDRVLLRPLVMADIDQLIDIATKDQDLLQYSPSPIYTPELLTQYIENALKDKQAQTRYPFIIFDKQLSAYAGSTSFMNISNKDKRLEIGATWIDKQFQGTGLNRQCKFLLLSYAFDQLGFERVEFRTDERNIRSRTAIEKIGGQCEGILRSHTLMTDGFRRNTVCYSILKNEWPALMQRFISD